METETEMKIPALNSLSPPLQTEKEGKINPSARKPTIHIPDRLLQIPKVNPNPIPCANLTPRIGAQPAIISNPKENIRPRMQRHPHLPRHLLALLANPSPLHTPLVVFHQAFLPVFTNRGLVTLARHRHPREKRHVLPGLILRPGQRVDDLAPRVAHHDA